MADYQDFHQLLTGYRKSLLLMLAGSLNIASLISKGVDRNSFLDSLHIHKESGSRLLKALEETGILVEKNRILYLTSFSERFLHPSSPDNQLNTIKMEASIMAKWIKLPDFMKEGKHKSVKIKSEEDYLKDLKIFLGSMDEAAKIRCSELWDKAGDISSRGTIIDFGAGSGAALKIFLNRYNKWNGIFCDLSHVIKIAEKEHLSDMENSRLSYFKCNLLNSEPLSPDIPKADIILYSNFLHCQSAEENRHILKKTLKYLKPDGEVIVHDFIPSLSPEGSLYDIHMMLNTYNGRTYSVDELEELFNENGFTTFHKELLPSGSGYLRSRPSTTSS